MPEEETGLRVVVSDGSGRRARAPGLAVWLRRVAPRRARGTVTIALVSDRRIRTLNRTYRGKDYATDVLSFANHQSAINQQSAVSNQQLFLGDIVIARGVAMRQARDAGHSPRTELKILALHGLLHLLGYDHERDDGQMRRVERRLLQQGGLRDGLIERMR